MKKLLFLSFIVAVLSVSGFAQCNVAAKDLSLRGIRLNMTIAEVEKLYELVAKKDLEVGVKSAVVRFSDVFYRLSFMEGKLHEIDAFYETEFVDTNQFVTALSVDLPLKIEYWTPDGKSKYGENFYRTKCKDFTAVTDARTSFSRFTITRTLPRVPFKP